MGEGGQDGTIRRLLCSGRKDVDVMKDIPKKPIVPPVLVTIPMAPLSCLDQVNAKS